jgi:hypothetical protein
LAYLDERTPLWTGQWAGLVSAAEDESLLSVLEDVSAGPIALKSLRFVSLPPSLSLCWVARPAKLSHFSEDGEAVVRSWALGFYPAVHA